jgi:hypothetical protein
MADTPGMSEGLISSRADWVAALRQGLLTAAAQGCRELCCFDSDFSQWPLSEQPVLDALTQWVLPHRRLRLLAAQYDDLRRVHPRFVVWRRHFDHVIADRQYSADELPSDGPQALLLAPGLFTLRLIDARSGRAVCSLEAGAQIGAREWFDAIEQRSHEAFSATTLGL